MLCGHQDYAKSLSSAVVNRFPPLSNHLGVRVVGRSAAFLVGDAEVGRAIRLEHQGERLIDVKGKTCQRIYDDMHFIGGGGIEIGDVDGVVAPDWF